MRSWEIRRLLTAKFEARRLSVVANFHNRLSDAEEVRLWHGARHSDSWLLTRCRPPRPNDRFESFDNTSSVCRTRLNTSARDREMSEEAVTGRNSFSVLTTAMSMPDFFLLLVLDKLLVDFRFDSTSRICASFGDEGAVLPFRLPSYCVRHQESPWTCRSVKHTLSRASACGHHRFNV